MTLSTEVYILDEVNPEEVFRLCQEMLTRYDDPRHLPPEQQQIRHEQDQTYTGTPGVFAVRPGNPWSLDNKPEQGLPAWLMIHYRAGEPLQAADPGHDEDCDEDCSGEYHARVCWMSVDFDTAYGYRDPRGWGCGDLHAAMVSELGAWLTARGVRWEWRNEFTGEVHNGPDGLTELGRAGAEARDWFGSAVLPAIVAEIATGGGGQLDVAAVGTFNVPDCSGQS